MLGQPFIDLSISNQHFKTYFHPPKKMLFKNFYSMFFL